MNDTGPILQYASVEPAGRLCLPTDSSLYIQHTDGGYRIMAAIKGKSGAVGGIAFACFVLLLFFSFIVPDLRRVIRTGTVDSLPVCVGSFCVMYAGLLLVVVNNTWRWTALDVTKETIKLTNRSFLSRREVSWTSEDLHNVEVDKVWVVARPGTHGQLRLTLKNRPPVILFAGHNAGMLEAATARIRQMLLS